jgi:type IX secretion system PorP/SprF family membrane protein
MHAQQEPMYSQYMFNLLHINPAYAGSRAVDNITLMYRDQWVGMDGAPKTGTLSWDKRKESSNVGYGATIYNDQIGVETTTGLQLFYSYHIPFENSTLALGLSGGILNYRTDMTQAASGLINSSDIAFANSINTWLPTAGVGLLFSTEKWYAGLSVPALLHTKSNDAVARNTKNIGAENHYFLTGGYIFDLSQSIKLKPSIMIKSVSGAPIEYDLNLNAWFNSIFCIGASYRTGDAIVGMAEFQITPQLCLGYSYDYSISPLSDYNKGTHEIMLRYEFLSGKQDKVLSPRYY